jgi:hypothetical protein
MGYTIAALAVETGISPSELLKIDDEMLRLIIQVLNDRAKEMKDASKRNRR